MPGRRSAGTYPEQTILKKARIQYTNERPDEQDLRLFDALATLLNTLPISVEILPGDGSEWRPANTGAPTSPFVFIEGNLGVPQKWLHKFYLLALPIFFLAKRKLAAERKSATISDTTVKKLAISSAVILLANPAHQTALNARKRLVTHERMDIEKELAFTAAIMSTKDGAKQSILWHHRSWLLQKLPAASVAPSSSKRPPVVRGSKQANLQTTLSWSKVSLSVKNPLPRDGLYGAKLSPERLKRELELIAQATEAYPRNYHAWAYRRQCLANALASRDPKAPDCPFTVLVVAELSFIRRWIELHISDHSAVHYLGALHAAFGARPNANSGDLSAVKQGYGHDEPQPISWPENTSPSLTHAGSLLGVYPDHPSLWMYLRMTADGPDQVSMVPFIWKVVRGWAMDKRLPGSFDADTQRQIRLEAFKFLVWGGLQHECFWFDEEEDLTYGSSYRALDLFSGQVKCLTDTLSHYWRYDTIGSRSSS